MFKYIFKRSPKEYYLSLLRYLVVFAVAAAVTFFACQIVQDGVIAILVRGMICLVIPNAIFFAVFHKREEFDEVKRLIMRILKR